VTAPPEPSPLVPPLAPPEAPPFVAPLPPAGVPADDPQPARLSDTPNRIDAIDEKIGERDMAALRMPPSPPTGQARLTGPV
jgi:hypothetical protein